MLALVSGLQHDLGVHYNFDRADDPDKTNSKDQFIHGMVGSDNGGTCVSMPVLYTAVGRRLGYPLYLVMAKGHLLCRWDDGHGTVQNFEGSSRGMSTHPDEMYRSWPHQITDEEMAHREYLVSLTPREELAVFLSARGHCLAWNDRPDEARETYIQAAALFPTARLFPYFVARLDESLRPAAQRFVDRAAQRDEALELFGLRDLDPQPGIPAKRHVNPRFAPTPAHQGTSAPARQDPFAPRLELPGLDPFNPFGRAPARAGSTPSGFMPAPLGPTPATPASFAIPQTDPDWFWYTVPGHAGLFGEKHP